MFDLHLGAQLRISSDKFKEGFFLTGNPGQGRSIFLAQTILELIKNKQKGLALDPFGDLTKEVLSHLKSPEAKKQVAAFDLDLSQKELNAALKKNLFVVASGKAMTDGYRQTAEKGIRVLKNFYKQATEGQWLLVDEAFNLIDDELFQSHLESKKMGLNVLLAAMDFFLLSKEERKKFAQEFRSFIIYKPRNINAVFMAKEKKELDPENIKAIQQYHFQLLLDGKVSYHEALHPLADI